MLGCCTNCNIAHSIAICKLVVKMHAVRSNIFGPQKVGITMVVHRAALPRHDNHLAIGICTLCATVVQLCYTHLEPQGRSFGWNYSCKVCNVVYSRTGCL